MMEFASGLIGFIVIGVLIFVLSKALKREEAERKRVNDAFVFACLEFGEYYSQKNKVFKGDLKNGNR